MPLFEKLQAQQEQIAIIGLGYVGLPLAVELAEKYSVVGFDINKDKIATYKNGTDVTHEVGNKRLADSTITFTDSVDSLRSCKWFIIAVPTPINDDKTPDLSPVITASEMVGEQLSAGSIVVFESTVYPGTTEEICIPILEERSGLKIGRDFKVGYSPERINPGDSMNTLTNITKIVSSTDQTGLDEIAALYDSIIDAGIHMADTIKIAEAAKVIENAQRDINIAFANELAMICHKMGIHTKSVLQAAATKWNFLEFTPGLVGGHCIGVDPYYFTYKAEQLGYHSQIILAGRKINDDMGKYIASHSIKKMIQAKQHIAGGRVAVLGITFKENVADVRNSKVIDIINELKDYGLDVIVHDPIADADDVRDTFSIDLVDADAINDVDSIIVAVPHHLFKHSYDVATFDRWFRSDTNVFIDVKSAYDKETLERHGYFYWSL
ncbi:MAG TPA: nucleotide sugar dehydrogenase [Virgibacillus sp.]|nr:nucleotide sugar dehydrogenase [Virgibacillus sp.]